MFVKRKVDVSVDVTKGEVDDVVVMLPNAKENMCRQRTNFEIFIVTFSMQIIIFIFILPHSLNCFICSWIHGRTLVTLANTVVPKQDGFPQDTTPTTVVIPPAVYVKGPKLYQKISYTLETKIIHYKKKIQSEDVYSKILHLPPLSPWHAPTALSPVRPAHNMLSVIG